MKYLASVVRIVHICAEKQSAFRPVRDTVGGKEEQSGPQPELDIKFPAISLANRLNQNIGLTAKGLSPK